MRRHFYLVIVVVAVAITALLSVTGVSARPRSEPNIEHAHIANWAQAIIKTDPIQSEVRGKKKEYHLKGYRLFFKKEFEVMGLVLSAKAYPPVRGDETTDLAPVDLAIGWGPMSDTKALETLHFGQKDRWYHFHWSGRAHSNAMLFSVTVAICI